jgi:penicillin-binding protein 1C
VATDEQWRFPLAREEISPHLINAIVAVEDARFYDHHGVDWKSVAGSGWENLSSLGTRRGASTLSMQLVRLRIPASRNLISKFFQAVRAQQLEEREKKESILLAYLNEAPFGGNLIGAGAASWRYFAKPCSQLSLAEAALLAGLPQNPNRLRPDRFPERAKSRRDHVLRRMLDLAMITETDFREAVNEPLHVAWHPLPQMKDDGSLPTLLRIAELYRGQYVQLTLDPTIQQTSNNLTREHLARLDASNISAAAVVVLDTESGEVLASVSCTMRSSKVDLTSSRRSTGSTLKPFIYAAAVDAGILSMSSKLDDHPRAWANYLPANFDRAYRGELTAAEALAESRNIPAMTVLSRVGVSRAINVMGGCGVRSVTYSPQRYGLPLAIGGAEASPLEIAEAYATLARGGVHRDATLPLPCTHGRGLGRGPSPEQESPSKQEAPLPSPLPEYGARELSSDRAILSRDTCLQVLSALSESNRTSRICPEATHLQPAWKTGTSSGHRDAWCAAVTPRRTVVVWLGNPRGEGSNQLIGTDAAAPLALRILAAVDQGGAGFELPSQIQKTLAQAPVDRPKLAILSPANGEQFVLEPGSVIDLKAHSTQSASLFWFVDGSSLESTRWTPTPGAHEIRVTDESGTTAVAKVVVREE